MKKLILLSFPFLFIGCSALITLERNNRLEDKKRTEMRKIEQEEKAEMRKIERFESIPFPHKIIEFPDLSTEEIYKNSYFWLEMKFSNYDTNNFVETRMDDKIRIEYKSDFALVIPNKIKILQLIIVIDLNQKTVKIGMLNPSAFSNTKFQTSGRVAFRGDENDEKLNQELEQEFELIQNYGDFINNNID